MAVPVKVPSGPSAIPGGSVPGAAVNTSGPPSASVAVTGAGVPPTRICCVGVGSSTGGVFGTVITRVVTSVPPAGSLAVTVTV